MKRVVHEHGDEHPEATRPIKRVHEDGNEPGDEHPEASKLIERAVTSTFDKASLQRELYTLKEQWKTSKVLRD